MVRKESPLTIFGAVEKGALAMQFFLPLREKDRYGYQIAVVLDEWSNGQLYVADNSLYGVLYRLSSDGYISSKKETNVGRPRVFYHLEPEGEAHLQHLIREYTAIKDGIDLFFERSKAKEVRE